MNKISLAVMALMCCAAMPALADTDNPPDKPRATEMATVGDNWNIGNDDNAAVRLHVYQIDSFGVVLDEIGIDSQQLVHIGDFDSQIDGAAVRLHVYQIDSFGVASGDTPVRTDFGRYIHATPSPSTSTCAAPTPPASSR